MTVETTPGFRLKPLIAAFELPAPAITAPNKDKDKPFSLRARLGVILLGALLSWGLVIASISGIVRLIGYAIH